MSLIQQATSDSIETVLADVFLAPEYQWRSPNLLSKLVNGAVPIKPDDERLLRVGEVLGLTAKEVFE